MVSWGVGGVIGGTGELLAVLVLLVCFCCCYCWLLVVVVGCCCYWWLVGAGSWEQLGAAGRGGLGGRGVEMGRR
jgi:hypothetical protein